jgi:hypothetical protein
MLFGTAFLERIVTSLECSGRLSDCGATYKASQCGACCNALRRAATLYKWLGSNAVRFASLHGAHAWSVLGTTATVRPVSAGAPPDYGWVRRRAVACWCIPAYRYTASIDPVRTSGRSRRSCQQVTSDPSGRYRVAWLVAFIVVRLFASVERCEQHATCNG